MFQSSLSFLLERAGIVLTPPSDQLHQTSQHLLVDGAFPPTQLPNSAATSNRISTAEVLIQIAESVYSDHHGIGREEQNNETSDSETSTDNGSTTDERFDLVSSPALAPRSNRISLIGDVVWDGQDSSIQGTELHHIGRWIEQIFPFFLLLLVVFIRQHLQGFAVAIGITVILLKSNDILQRQVALKGDSKIYVFALISIFGILYVIGLYYCYRNDDLLPPLVMLPPKVLPRFRTAVFIIIINDALVRQAAMTFKCLLLLYYKNGGGLNYYRQGQMLTLVEHMLLLYRTMIPTPVWFRFLLNKENGCLFSSLTTGFYLTFKITCVIEKVKSLLAAWKALSQKEVHYRSYATAEQVSAAGDLCAICQEKMYYPVLLHCRHIFCEECVSEWFEREGTCPLCWALLKPRNVRSFGDGSTSIVFQLF
ncbi:uncharacterized protein LOC126660261 isoform X2 [Mercurialis annua]|uniref:uncharacterized protein LOC126660259 isoform X2 n=1 Tax=Mercurialis annua TaxID=3986 RepID=UPI00215E45D9|nr:uncharacterized protein LOC126660259 isoform X2 [Mercurialis annua]XP_050209614.1 uncharacterized protein LOC126660261 isoform X2 [Mercurialis annua]